jgi:large subunit ribosomal protein L25
MDIQLVAQLRDMTGKNEARSLRRQEMVPAVFYGPRSTSLPITVPMARLEKLFRDMGDEHKLLSLIIEDGQNRQEKHVMIREVQVHPARRQLLHVDFYEVAMDQAIEVDVPVELKGKPLGVEKGGILNQIRRTLTVRCLPGEIPEKVEVDVSAVDIGASIKVADLIGVVPYVLTDDHSFAVAAVVAPEGAAEATENES